jgi:hypothetical protein
MFVQRAYRRFYSILDELDGKDEGIGDHQWLNELSALF